MKPDIFVTDDPSVPDRTAILDALIDYNASRVGPAQLNPLAILLRDRETGETIGGLYSYLLYDWLYIELLVVPETLRGVGLGSDLVRRAESVAVERGCIGVWLNTFSFQARGFYEKLGYEVFGVLDDNPRGSQRFFLRKLFPAGQSLKSLRR
jgi:GNAT superfamily N-acetyltransferase